MYISKKNQTFTLYERTISEFSSQEKGVFLLFTNDNTFIKLFRNILTKQISISSDSIFVTFNRNIIDLKLREIKKNSTKCILFIERVINSETSTEFIKHIKSIIPNILIIVLTSEVERSSLVLLHEIGVNNFITKPLTIKTLIEKIAFTVRPQSKIGELIDSCRQLIQQQEFEKALQTCHTILRLKPGSPAGLMLQGDIYQSLNNDDLASQSYIQAHQNAKEYLEPLKKLAEFYGQKQDHGQEIVYMEKLDRLSPLNVERKLDLGNRYLGIGEQEKAKSSFDAALSSAAKEARSKISKVAQSIAESWLPVDPQVAENYFRKALDQKKNSLSNEDIDAFNRLGIALRKQGKWEQAVEEYQKALQIAPHHVGIHYNIAMALSEGHRYTQAVQHLEDVIKLEPEFYKSNATIAHNMGLIYFYGRDKNMAQHLLKQALQIDPSRKDTKELLEKSLS